MLNKGNYLSHLNETMSKNLKRNQINLIHSPANSGKTTWALDSACNVFSRGQAAYDNYEHRYNCLVVDTTLLKDHVIEKYKTYCDENNIKLIIVEGEYGEYIIRGLKIFTYAGFAVYLQHHKSNFFKIFIDEVHRLIKFNKTFSDNEHYTYLLNKLPELMESSIVYAMSATPQPFIAYCDEINIPCVDILGDLKNTLQRTTEAKELTFNTRFDYQLNKLNIDKNNKALICCTTIKECKAHHKMLSDKGLVGLALWSRINPKHPYSAEQNELYEYLLNEHRLPDHYDYLIINTAFETGWDLYGIKTVAVNSPLFTVAYQFRHRVREDIDLYVHPPFKCSSGLYDNLDLKALVDYVRSLYNKPLFKEDQIEIGLHLYELGIGNTKKQPCTTTKAIVAALIEFQDYYCIEYCGGYNDFYDVDFSAYDIVIEPNKQWNKQDKHRKERYNIIHE